MSPMLSLLFSRKSERKIMSVLRSTIDLIFFNCLGHVVDTFSELQFWQENDKFKRKLPIISSRLAGTGPAPAALLGDLAGSGLHVPLVEVEVEHELVT